MSPSLNGVSRTRLSPYLAHRPSVAPKTPPLRPTSSPMTMTRSSRSISSSIAERIASRMFISAMSAILRVHEAARRGRVRIGSRLGTLGGFVDFLLDLRPQPLVDLIGQQAQGPQLVGEQGHRVLLLQRVDLGGVSVAALVVVRLVAGQPDHTGFDEGWAAAASRALVRLLAGRVAGEDVAAVDRNALESVANRTGSD